MILLLVTEKTDTKTIQNKRALRVATFNSPNSIFTLPVGNHLFATGLYLRVRESGKRVWLARVKVSGKETMLKLGELPAMTLSGAKKAREAAKTDADRGVAVRPAKAEKKQPLLGDPQILSNIWAEYVRVAPGAGIWSAEHAKKTDGQMLKHIAPLPIWGRSVADIKRAEFVAACKTITSAEVRQRIFRWLRGAVEAACDAGTLESSPFGNTLPAEIKRPRSDKGTLASEMRDIEDLRSLLSRSWHSTAALSVRAVHRVCALSGHRIGAVLAARPNDVNLEEKSWTVPRERMKVKTAVGDVVIKPLSPQLLEVLKQAKERAEATGSDWLFPSVGGTSAVTHAAVEKHVRRLLGESPRFTPHAWRSAVMSWALEGGYPREVAQAALDHARGTDSDRAYDRSTLTSEVSKMLTQWAQEVAPL
jgi:integrase